MAWSHSSYPAFSTYFQRMSALLIWILLRARVDADQPVSYNDEVGTLLRFKEDNQDWGGVVYLANWLTNWQSDDNQNPCAWTGVTCSNDNTVLGLAFPGSSSSYGTPTEYLNLAELSNLRGLRRLDLSSNRLVGGLFDVGNLTGLTHLDLSSNNLTDFPIGICKLTNLTRLDLSSNSIDSRVPSCISACTSLRFISLQQNQLYGTIPSLRDLVNLQFLLLLDNQLSGPFPKELGELTNILVVDLSKNSLTGTIPALPKAKNLVHLYLDSNNFTDFEEAWFIGANSSLQTLSFSLNQLEGKIPSSMTDLPNLQYLNMSFNQLSGNIPFGFSNAQFDVIDLSQNRLSGKIPTDLQYSFGKGSMFRTLNLSHNLLNGSIPLDNLQISYTNLYVLDLSYNNLSGPISSNMFGMSTNEGRFSLWLQNNSLSGDIIDILIGAPRFDYTLECRLENNLLTGDLSRIANSTSLSSPSGLDLSNNNIRWSTSEAIPDPISATLTRFMSKFPNSPYWLSLGGNNFLGTSLPTTACVNTERMIGEIEGLDLSNSRLEGQMLGTYFNSSCFPDLQFLNLSNNAISGPVPNETFTLPLLQSLDLSNNYLSGRLPPIPSNSTLFNPDIFAGNVGLCGPPLDVCTEAPPIIGYPPPPYTRTTRLQRWVLILTIGGSLTIAVGSCLAATWRWRVYLKRHQQDADLINTLLERDSATLMPLRELKKATDNFAESAQIGEGGFGTVYTGKLNDGSIVAIKRSKREGSDKDKEQFLNEVRILSQVQHRNLVKLLGCCMENKIALLVFEFVSNGTLQDHLQGKFGDNHLSWKQRLRIAVQTANALTYLHTATKFPIYHRDVKSANILLDEDLNAKVADFGISKLAPLQATHVSTVAVQGTMGYIDPEYYTSYRLTDKSDVFSFGVVLLELISAKLALDLRRDGEHSSLVNLARPHIMMGDLQGFIDPALMETYSDPARHGRESMLNVGRLALRCVDMRSKSRPSMNEVLKDLMNLWVELSGIRTGVREDDHEGTQELQNLWVELTGTRKGISHCITED